MQMDQGNKYLISNKFIINSLDKIYKIIDEIREYSSSISTMMNDKKFINSDLKPIQQNLGNTTSTITKTIENDLKNSSSLNQLRQKIDSNSEINFETISNNNSFFKEDINLNGQSFEKDLSQHSYNLNKIGTETNTDKLLKYQQEFNFIKQHDENSKNIENIKSKFNQEYQVQKRMNKNHANDSIKKRTLNNLFMKKKISFALNKIKNSNTHYNMHESNIEINNNDNSDNNQSSAASKQESRRNSHLIGIEQTTNFIHSIQGSSRNSRRNSDFKGIESINNLVEKIQSSRRNSRLINLEEKVNNNFNSIPAEKRIRNLNSQGNISNINSIHFKTNIFKMGLKYKINQKLIKRNLITRIDPVSFKLDKQSDFHFMGEVETNWSLWNNLQIREDSLFSFTWTIIILVIMMFHIVIFPFITFSEKHLADTTWQIFLNLFMEWIFVLDIGFNFLTSFKNPEGIEIKSLSMIAENQLSTWFLLDLISSIPIDNMQYFELLNNDVGTVYLRLLKLPKQLRIFRIWLNIFTNKLSDAIMFSNYINISNSQFQMQVNTIKYFITFIIISNNLVCQMVSYAHQCNDHYHCSNWYFELAQKEFIYSVKESYSQYHKFGTRLIETYNQEEAELRFYNMTYLDRTLVQQNAWYFVLQSVTTVGYGDIDTNSTNERMFRSICMCLGVALFTLASSSILETSITESLNIQSSKENEIMIEKMQVKQGLRGEAKRQIGLLCDSVQTDNLREELEFAKMLPRQMSDCVLSHIHIVQKNKFPVLGDEDMNLFSEMMEVSQFRRCVFDEIVQSEDNKVSIVQSGQVGASFPNSFQYTLSEYLYQYKIGDEIGFKNQINFDETNVIQSCTNNSELVEINSHKFFRLMLLHSIKGVNQIFEKIHEYLTNFYLILSLQQGMLMQGYQIDLEWQKKVMIFMSFDLNDIDVLTKLQVKQRGLISNNDHISQDDKVKWQECILDLDLNKYIKNKIKIVTFELLKSKYKDQQQQGKLIGKNNNKFNVNSQNIMNNRKSTNDKESVSSMQLIEDLNKKKKILFKKSKSNSKILEDDIEIDQSDNERDN